MYSGTHWTQIDHPVIQSEKPDLLSFLSASKPDSQFFKSGKSVTVWIVLPHNRLTGSSNPESRIREAMFCLKTGQPVIQTGKPNQFGTHSGNYPENRITQPASRIRGFINCSSSSSLLAIQISFSLKPVPFSLVFTPKSIISTHFLCKSIHKT